VDSINKIKTDKLHAILPHVQQKFIRTNLGEKPSILLLLAKKLYKSNTPTIIFWYVLFMLARIPCGGSLVNLIAILQNKNNRQFNLYIIIFSVL